MSIEANKELVRRLYEEAFNEGDLDLVDQLVAPDVATHNPIILDAPTGPDSIRGGIEMIRKAFPDFQVEVEDLIAEGDRVAAFLTMSGTNEGDYRRGGATGKRGTMRAFFIWRVEDGRLAESWGVLTGSGCSRSSESSPRTTSSPRGCPSAKRPTDAARIARHPRGVLAMARALGSADPDRSRERSGGRGAMTPRSTRRCGRWRTPRSSCSRSGRWSGSRYATGAGGSSSTPAGTTTGAGAAWRDAERT